MKVWRRVTMARVAVGDVVERVRALLRPAAEVFAGLAVVLLVWALVLGWWSRLGAPRAMKYGDWRVAATSAWGNSLPGGMPIRISVVVALLAAAVVFTCVRARRRRDLPGLPAAWTVIAVLVYFGYLTAGIPSFYRAVMNNYPVSSAVPAAVAAWVLCLVGAAAMLVGLPAIGRFARSSPRLLVGGAVIGVVVAVATTAIAVRAGDDGRYLDATTAEAVQVPAPPTIFGERAFTVTVPDGYVSNPDQTPAHYQIQPAGAGFVVFKDNRITAYGVDGQERWHYARTGPRDVLIRSMRVVDDAGVVLALMQDGVVALDGVTGEQLWASADSRLAYAARGHGVERSGSNLMFWDREKPWTRFDARTGRELWTVDRPHVDCSGRDPILLPARVVSVGVCQSTGELRLTALDAHTGQTVWDTAVLQGIPYPAERPAEGYFDMYLDRISSVGVVINSGGLGASAGPMYVNVGDETITQLPKGGIVAESPGPTDDFVIVNYEADVDLEALLDPDGHERCIARGINIGERSVPGQHGGWGFAYVTLPTSFVVFDTGDFRDEKSRKALRTFDSTTCMQTAQVPAEGVQGFVPVPGAVLVLRREGATLQIDGYRAG